MGTLYVDTLEPEGGTTTLTVGETGQNMVIGGNTIKFNILQDAGGNAIFTSNGSGTLSSVNSGFGSNYKLLNSQTVTDTASVTFTSDIDSTYDSYIFRFYLINPVTDNVQFQFQGSTDGGSNYNVATTSSFYLSSHSEAGSSTLSYDGTYDQATGTGYQTLWKELGNGADECTAGELHLFNPSSTTYHKSYYARLSGYTYHNYSQDDFIGGTFQTTSAINAVSYKMSSGNFDGTIKMFGLK